MPHRPFNGTGTIPDELRVLFRKKPGITGFHIALLANYFSGPLYAQMLERYGILRDEFAVLANLYDCGTLSAKEICIMTGRPKNSVSRAVARLEASGRLRCEVNKNDRREIRLTLLAEGRKLYERILPMCRDRNQYLLEPLNAEEALQLNGLLTKMLEAYHDRSDVDDSDL